MNIRLSPYDQAPTLDISHIDRYVVTNPLQYLKPNVYDINRLEPLQWYSSVHGILQGMGVLRLEKINPAIYYSIGTPDSIFNELRILLLEHHGIY